MRAREPDEVGHVVRAGVHVRWERYGERGPTVVLLPTWALFPAEHWKHQVPYLARTCRVIVVEGRGRPDRPRGPAAYTVAEHVADVEAVLDALPGADPAVLLALSRGAMWALGTAAARPGQVAGIVAIGPAVPVGGPADRDAARFEADLPATTGWATYNVHHWRRDLGGFVGFFVGEMFPEPHSTKAIEDGVAWGTAAGAELLVDTTRAAHLTDPDWLAGTVGRVTCPVLVVHGDADGIRPHASGAALADAVGGELVTIVGGGHAPHLRDPVAVNRLIAEFVTRVVPAEAPRRRTWTRAASRPRRALYLSSPIGLGHARRDLAVAGELRRHHPDLEIDWLAQHPVTQVLRDSGERVHPASAWLASESSHVEDEAGEHDLHAFQAIRRMDEVLVNNFMVFHDVVTEQHYDLVIGDEAWDVDYFLHENPELKRFAFAWMTDFVGWIPMPDGGAAEAALTADYNAEMIEQRARYRHVRDRSIFVGEPDDIVPGDFGPGLPAIRDWTAANFEFAGYITGIDDGAAADREAVRAELGYGPDERVCIVTVGGSGVGGDLLRRVVAAAPAMHRLIDDLRLVVVCGPRLDPAALPDEPGVCYRRYVADLHRHLAACDVAVVQGGLTTCMELTAHRRPFVYVPLRHHFEQQFHVHHRLTRYGAGRRVDYEQFSDPRALAEVVAAEIGRPVDYRPVARDGAARAAASLAALLG